MKIHNQFWQHFRNIFHNKSMISKYNWWTFWVFKKSLNILYCAPGELFLDNLNSEITFKGRRNPELIGAISRYLFWCWAYVIYHYSPMHNFREEGWIPFLDKFHHPFYIARFLFHKTHLYLRIWVNVTNSSLLLDPLK